MGTLRVELPRFLKEFGATVSFDDVVKGASPDIRAIFESDVLPGGPGFVSEAAYAAARDTQLPMLRKLYSETIDGARVSALLFPATMIPAPPIGADGPFVIGGRTVTFEVAVARNIAPGSTAGVPGLVLPSGMTAQGLPVAMEFDAASGSDRELLALGVALERALGPVRAPRV